MFASLVNRVTVVFHRKVRETYCGACGYRVVEQARDKAVYHR